VRCEIEVYEAVLRWVSHDVERRSAKLIQLLRAVRCYFLSPSFLLKQLNTCVVVRRIPQCHNYLNSIVVQLQQHIRCADRPRGLNPSIYIVGGYLRHSLAAVDCWCPKSDRWYRLADLSTPRSGVSACQVCFKISLNRNYNFFVCVYRTMV